MASSPSFDFSPSEGSPSPRAPFKPHAKFTQEDDEHLRKIVTEFGDNNWLLIAEHMPGRNPRQCKERWLNYLTPALNRAPWSAEEDALLIRKQSEIGSKWVRIAAFFENRTDAMVKNRFQVLKRREAKTVEPASPPRVELAPIEDDFSLFMEVDNDVPVFEFDDFPMF